MSPGYKTLLVSVLIIMMTAGCQRDDICSAATQTTPMLLISFFDAEDRVTPKAAPNLLVREIFYDTIIYNRESTAEIRIPLRVDSGTTEYEFVLNAPVDGAANESSSDRVTFSYDPEEIYISRACSFKVNFRNIAASVIPGNNSWIQSITIVEENIENETSAHIHIFH